MYRRPGPTALLVAVLSCAGAARATPFLVPHLGGPVFVGPVDAHVTSLYWNPAAIGLLQGSHFFLSGTGRLDLTGADRATISTADGEPSAGGDRSFPSATLAPVTIDNFAGYITDLSSSAVTIGIALYSPYAENIASNDSLAYHSAGGLFYAETAAIGLAYRVEPWLIIGVTGNLIFSSYHLQFARDAVLDSCAAAPCSVPGRAPGVENAANAERYDLSASIVQFPSIDASFGFILRLGDWTFGMAAANFLNALARSSVSLLGDASVTPAGQTAAVTGHTTISFKLPATVDLGAKRRLFADWDLILGARWTHLSTQDKLDLRVYGRDLTNAGIADWIERYRGLDDVWWAEVGLEEPPATAVRWGARVRFTTGGVPANAVAIDQIDGPGVDLSGGLELRFGERFGVTVGYTLALMLPRDVTTSAFSPSAAIACNAAQHDIDTPGCAAIRDGRAIPTAAGSYWRVSNQLTLGLGIDLW